MTKKRELRVTDYLQHILDSIERIQGYLTGSDERTFAKSLMAQDAVIRNLEVIGEAAIKIRSLDAAAAAEYPEWGQICGMQQSADTRVFRHQPRGRLENGAERSSAAPTPHHTVYVVFLKGAHWRAANRL